MGSLACGIDEAGVGSIIGPVIFAGVAMSQKAADAARAAGIADSKSMTCDDVSSLYKQITGSAHAMCRTVAIPPEEIDRAAVFDRVGRRKRKRRGGGRQQRQRDWCGGAREQRVHCAARIISELSSACGALGHEMRTAYVDSFDADAGRLGRDIARAVRGMAGPHPARSMPDVVVQAGADCTFIQASAASIVAGAIHRIEVQRIRDVMAASGYSTSSPDAFGPADNAQMYRFIYDYYIRHGRLPGFVRAESRPMRRLARHKVARPVDLDMLGAVQQSGGTAQAGT